MTRMMFDDDASRPSFSAASSPAWEKSLCRKLAQFIVSLLKKIYNSETLEEDSPPSVVSKKSFYDRLSKTMTSYRGTQEDSSRRLIWITYPTRRLGNQFKSSSWCCEAALIDIQAASIPTAIVTPTEKRTRSLDCPDSILASCTSDFGQEMTHANLNPLRVIAIRIMMFHKEYLVKKGKLHPEDEVKPSTARRWIDQYNILPGVTLRRFFWREDSWKEFAKQSFYRSGRYVSPTVNPKKVEDHRKIWMNARSNQKSWDRITWDPMSIFGHSAATESENIFLESIEGMIKSGHSPKEINAAALSNGLISENYVRYLWNQYQLHKERALVLLTSSGSEGLSARKRFKYKG